MKKLTRFILFSVALICGLALFQNCGSPKILKGSVTLGSISPSENPSDSLTDPSILIFSANDLKLSHQIGRLDNAGWASSTVIDESEKFLNYGPYIELAAGYKKVTFDLEMLNPNEFNDIEQKIITIDVFDSTNNKLVTSRDIWFEDLKAQSSEFAVVFNALEKTKYEFRTFWHGSFDIILKKITVKGADFGKYGDLFDKKTVFQKAGTVPGGNGWITVHNNIWYHFDRLFRNDSTLPSFCSASGTLSIAVHESKDKGQTWSTSKVAVAPSLIQTDDDACYVVDGTTFYEPLSAKWLTLSQCLGQTGSKWKLCLYESTEVVGPYTRKDINFKPGQLWKQICAGSNKACPLNVFDEGTPDYLYTLRGWHYFTFHGYDGRNGYRGMARTKDFITWKTTGPELIGDALLTSVDCQSWNPGCIGAGHAAALRSGDFIYMLWEGPTINLSCHEGQYWPFGLSRSYKFERSGNWETGPVNPYLAPIGNYLCGTQYARFVPDGDDLYMFYDYAEMVDGVRNEKYFLYKLTHSKLPTPEPITYSGASPLLKHLVGVSSGSAWESLSPQDTGFLSYGPYTTDWANGFRQISFMLSATDTLLTSNDAIVRIDLHDSTTGQIIEEKIIYENEFSSKNIPMTFNLPMPFADLTGHSLEARVYVYGKRAIKIHSLKAN